MRMRSCVVAASEKVVGMGYCESSVETAEGREAYHSLNR